ncbi:MAG: hypothetical protein AABX61_00100 [Nanoarchaeota archaeon]
MNKKAVFMPVFSFLVLILLTGAYYELFIKGINNQYNSIGENQKEIIQAYNKGQEYELNAEYAVRYSSYSAIQDFIKNSGVLEKCNNTWQFNSECDPDLQNNFINLFNLELSSYNYKLKEVKLQENTLIVTLEDFNYQKELKNFKVNYALPIIIKQDMTFDLKKITDIKEEIRKCAEKGEDLNTCVNEKNQVQGSIIQFTVENNKNILVFEQGKLESKRQDFTFKINTNNIGIEKQKVF